MGLCIGGRLGLEPRFPRWRFSVSGDSLTGNLSSESKGCGPEEMYKPFDKIIRVKVG